MVGEATCGALLAASDHSIFTPVDAAHTRESWERLFLHFLGNLICCAIAGEGGWCLGKMFLSVGGGRDPLAGRSKSSSLASVKGQLWRERPEDKGVGATCVPFSLEYGKGWNSECPFDVGTCTAHRFTAVMGLSSSPGPSVSPGLAHTQDNCSW